MRLSECPVRITIDVIEGKWKPIIVNALKNKVFVVRREDTVSAFLAVWHHGALPRMHGRRLLPLLDRFHGTHLVHQDALDLSRRQHSGQGG